MLIDDQIFRFKTYTSLGTAIAGNILNDPGALTRKITHLLKLIKAKGQKETNTQTKISRNENLIHARTATGELSFDKMSDGVQESLEIEQLPVRRSRNQNTGQNVLMYLNNSIPHTKTGYTFRSHSLLKQLTNQGVLVRAYTRLGYPITIGVRKSQRMDKVDGVTYIRLFSFIMPRSNEARLKKTARQLIRENGGKVRTIHTTTPFTNGLIAETVAGSLGIPWIYEIRGEPERTWLSKIPKNLQPYAEKSEKYTRSRERETEVAKRADAVIVLSEISAMEMTERGVSREKIHVIPNSVDEHLISKKFDKTKLREELGLPVNTPIVGSVSSVIEYEGFETLVASIPLTTQETHVMIVGDGPDLPHLRRIAAKLGITGKTHLPGRIDESEAWKWYAALDVFVIPRVDTLVCRTVTPVKPLIAMALGIPIIASDLPALREVTDHKAYFVEPENHHALATAIDQVLRSTERPNRAVAESKTWQASAEKLAKIYNTLANTTGAPHRRL